MGRLRSYILGRGEGEGDEGDEFAPSQVGPMCPLHVRLVAGLSEGRAVFACWAATQVTSLHSARWGSDGSESCCVLPCIGRYRPCWLWCVPWPSSGLDGTLLPLPLMLDTLARTPRRLPWLASCSCG